jgi:hypothetical protein
MSWNNPSLKKPLAAIGFRAHSGWTAFVVLGMAARAGKSPAPVVLDRGRIELVQSDARWFKQPYHAAAGMDLKDAQKFLRRCAAHARLRARRALRDLTGKLRANGHEVAGCGVVLGSGRPLPPLASTLRSHAMIHTAEGVFFREALVRASGDCDLPVTGVGERELLARAVAQLRLPVPHLRSRLAAMGKTLGPPWRQDEKYSALVAWLAMSSREEH